MIIIDFLLDGRRLVLRCFKLPVLLRNCHRRLPMSVQNNMDELRWLVPLEHYWQKDEQVPGLDFSQRSSVKDLLHKVGTLWIYIVS